MPRQADLLQVAPPPPRCTRNGLPATYITWLLRQATLLNLPTVAPPPPRCMHNGLRATYLIWGAAANGLISFYPGCRRPGTGQRTTPGWTPRQAAPTNLPLVAPPRQGATYLTRVAAASSYSNLPLVAPPRQGATYITWGAAASGPSYCPRWRRPSKRLRTTLGGAAASGPFDLP